MGKDVHVERRPGRIAQRAITATLPARLLEQRLGAIQIIWVLRNLTVDGSKRRIRRVEPDVECYRAPRIDGLDNGLAVDRMQHGAPYPDVMHGGLGVAPIAHLEVRIARCAE